MSEPTPTLPPAAADEPPVYRPLSGLAIAGFGLAVISFGWLAVSTVVALVTATPLLIEPVWLLLPLAGAILSGVARFQVARSEGTRAGLPLARWGLLLSIVPVLLYLSWRVVTEQTLKQQAREFTDRFLDLARQGDTDAVAGYAAFSGALDPARRDPRLDPDNPETVAAMRASPKEFASLRQSFRHRYSWGEKGQKGILPLFFEQELNQRLRQAGEQAQVTYLGVRTWEYHGGRAALYKVEQDYRIATPEATLDVSVPVVGTQAKEGGRRQWHVLLGEVAIRQRNFTELGNTVGRLRQDSRMFAAEWVKKLAQGHLDEAYRDTLPPGRRDSAERELPWRTVLSALQAPTGAWPTVVAYAPLADPLLARDEYLPGYAAFSTGQLVRDRELMAIDPKIRAEMARQVRELFQTGKKSEASLVVAESMGYPSSMWQLDPAKREARFLQPFQVRVGSIVGEGTLVVATDSEPALQALQGGPGGVDLSRTSRNVHWWIAGLNLEMAGQPPPRPPGR